MRTLFAALLMLCVMATAVYAAAPAASAPSPRPETLTLEGTGTVEDVPKADMILLTNGKRYRLENISVPPFEEATAIAVLKKELVGKMVDAYTSHAGEDVMDRYGLPLVQIVRDDGLWVQEYLVQNGLAWAYSTLTSRRMIDLLKPQEEQARKGRRGFWANAAYSIKTPANVQDSINSFQLVEGKVLYATKKKGTIFFNFSDDWKKDFTITLSRESWKLFGTDERGAESFDPETWIGAIVRIRGWVDNKNGPMIELTHPEQMEFVTPAPTPAPAAPPSAKTP